AAVEEVDRMLAANGPSAAGMDDVMELLVSRFGYRYFVAVLDGTNLDEARRVANDVGRELESAPLEGADGEMLRATVSAGCASLGPDVASFETLLEVADVGLQMAKRGGRNRVVAA
ncbi:MAG: diguanylate cyclase, partial [Candidatus Limnocylindrales bacterium]